MSTDTLIDYLGHVYNLESELYGIRETINSLNWKREESKHIREKQLRNEFKLCLDDEYVGGSLILSIILSVVLAFPLKIIDLNNLSLTFAKLFGIICGSFFVVFLIYFYIHKKESAETRKENEIIERENIQIRQYRSQQITLYDQMISNVQNTCDAVQQTLNEYYSLNIIFSKYQGLVPVASFYEYLTSGRCDGLTGVYGAYNKYEEELRQNLIIAKLDTIIQQLESIKNNQYMLYQAINNQMQVVNNLNYNVQNAMNRMDSIQATQYIQTYNQEVLAKNTQELVAYKRWSEIRQ